VRNRYLKIGFIGVGNMGGAILGGLLGIDGKVVTGLLAADIDAGKLKRAAEKGVVICESIGQLVEKSDVIMLGVKPNTYDEVLPQIARSYENSKLLISMAAGVKISYIEKYLGCGAKVIRVMPNLPALVKEAMTSVCRNKNITDGDMEQALTIFGSVGRACETPEELIHCVIGVSGSSPAYTYMYIEALADAAVSYGMDKEQALVFAAQSVLGAAKMVLETGIDPETLRINVCSPGGTTIEAVQKLQENRFAEVIKAGFSAAVEKSKKMTRE